MRCNRSRCRARGAGARPSDWPCHHLCVLRAFLDAGAAAGMAATFGSPVSAVLVAVELLLFEYRPRSLIPVALASAAAAGVRALFEGSAPVFALAPLAQPTQAALAAYAVLGAI